jgi:hypothetical protein
MKKLFLTALCFFMFTGTALGALVNLGITSMNQQVLYAMPYGFNEIVYFNLTNSTSVTWTDFHVAVGNQGALSEAYGYSGPGTGTFTFPGGNSILDVSSLNIPVGQTYAFSVWATGDNVSGATVNILGYPTAAPVPIPAAIWLLGSGLIGLIGIRKFRK